MTDQALEIVRNMKDIETVRFLTHFGKMLFQETPRDVILKGIAPEVESLDAIRRLQSLGPEARQVKLGPQESVRIARKILFEMTNDDALSSALVDAWDNYESNELFVEAILASGFVAAMLMFMSTTEIEFQVKGLKFRKNAATPELVRAIWEPIVEALGRSIGG